MEEPNREEIKAMIEITDANRLPYDLNELRTKVINWREVTNDFDFYTIRDIINRWSDDNEQRIVARIIGSNMGVDKTKGIHIDYLEAAINLTCMYQYKPGTDKRKNMEKLVSYLEERYRKRLISDFKSYKKGLTAQVGKLKSDLEKERERSREKDKRYLEELKAIKIENEELKKNPDPEQAFNLQTNNPCFTSRQMGILLWSVSLLTEEEPPAKTTIGDMVEKIAGYAATTINQNMKGTFREADKKAVADAIQSKCPKLAEKVMKL